MFILPAQMSCSSREVIMSLISADVTEMSNGNGMTAGHCSRVPRVRTRLRAGQRHQAARHGQTLCCALEYAIHVCTCTTRHSLDIQCCSVTGKQAVHYASIRAADMHDICTCTEVGIYVLLSLHCLPSDSVASESTASTPCAAKHNECIS